MAPCGHAEMCMKGATLYLVLQHVVYALIARFLRHRTRGIPAAVMLGFSLMKIAALSHAACCLQ